MFGNSLQDSHIWLHKGGMPGNRDVNLHIRKFTSSDLTQMKYEMSHAAWLMRYTRSRFKVHVGGVYDIQGGDVYKIQGPEIFRLEKGRFKSFVNEVKTLGWRITKKFIWLKEVCLKNFILNKISSVTYFHLIGNFRSKIKLLMINKEK